MKTKSPWDELVECCFYEGIYRFVSGEVPLDGMQDFIDHRIEELMDTDEFKEICNKYFGSFVDVKDLNNCEMYLMEDNKNVD